ncbi:hypothetical protein LC048_05335 [Mesobacillus subterraneus]|uniref:hypothetical protein n=1 Tax=Mesobacillus subterraneus TaxID=285983 RepID=UPI00273EBCAC|nr:hypothetical protein [Mesobacillus subterraneus]WLR56344.1 hypothetical protein LC048_05335 [Mesobacillus subterraneus]
MEEYLYWKVTEFLIVKKEYRILQLSQEHGELWLEKTENKNTQVVRLLHYNLDWSNWLLRDIGMTAENGDRIRRKLAKGELKILNLYFSAYSPVDDYEFRMTEPTLSENGKVNVESIIVDRANASEALWKIENRMDGNIEIDLAEEYSVDDIESIKKKALSSAVGRAKEEQSIFNYGKPFFTYLFIAVQVLMFLVLEAAGGKHGYFNADKIWCKIQPSYT